MKYLVLFLFPLIALADSKQEQYVASCEASFQRIISQRQPDKTEVAKKLAKDSCADMKSHLDQQNKWNTVTNPKLDACSDAIYMMADEKLKNDRKAREKMTLAYCF